MIRRFMQCRTVTHPEQFSGTDISIGNSVNAPFNSLILTGSHLQDGAPAPDNPIPIVPARGKMYVAGRNMFNGVYRNGYFDRYKIISFAETAVSQYLMVLPCQGGKTYTIQKEFASQRFWVAFTDTYPQVDTPVKNYISDNDATTITVASASTSKYLVAYIWNTVNEGYDPPRVWVSLGSTPIPYCPYQPIQEITPPDLYGASGVRDEWDAAAGAGVRRWKTHVFDGTEPIALYGYPPLPELDGFRYNTEDIKQASRGDGSCNVLPTIKNDVPPGVWFSRNDSNVFFVGVRAIVGNSVEEIKAYLAAEYANGTPWIITYQLAEPEAFSQGEQAVRTYYPETHIWTDAAVKPAVTATAKIIGPGQASGEGVVTLPGTFEPLP